MLVVAFGVKHLFKDSELVLNTNRERLVYMLHISVRLLQILASVLVHDDSVLYLAKTTR